MTRLYRGYGSPHENDPKAEIFFLKKKGKSFKIWCEERKKRMRKAGIRFIHLEQLNKDRNATEASPAEREKETVRYRTNHKIQI